MAKKQLYPSIQSKPEIEEARELIRELLKVQISTMRNTQKALDIDAPGLEVMMHLAANGECNPSDLAKHLDASTAATSLIIQRLEDMGHVTRKPDPSDGRKVIVSPNKASLQTAYKSGDSVVKGTIEVLESLSATELKTVKKFLEKLVKVHKNNN